MPKTKQSKLPADSRPLPLDPDLSGYLEAVLAPYVGKKLEAAQRAIITVRHSGVIGSWTQMTNAYSEAIAEAVGAV